MDEHTQAQKCVFNRIYEEPRDYWFSEDVLTKYLVRWRLKRAINVLLRCAGTRLSVDSKFLFLCAGDGAEASICVDEFNLTEVTFSDISSVAVNAGVERDGRLNGIVIDAQTPDLPSNSFDVVVIQDGLHHLRSPVQGFTEMLRIARVGVIFIESHDVFVGRIFGTRWEVNDGTQNFCFRWRRSLVEQVASSWTGNDHYKNLSFSYWHHNIVLAKLGMIVGGGKAGKVLVATIKYILDHLLPGCGNMFSGIVLKG